ncbi:hypothetical protein MHYP_G00289530 [Metynnis hypsauchen]
MVEEVLSHDEKTKKTFVDLLKQVPLSDSTAVRRVEVLAEDCLCALLSSLKKADFMSLAIDTSCDRTDIEQLSVFMRFFDEKAFREELLCLLPLHGHTTGKNHTTADMYEVIEAFRLKLGLFERDIQGRKLHFPKLKQHCEKNKMQEDAVMRAFLGRLIENFKVRLESFNLSSEILSRFLLLQMASGLLRPKGCFYLWMRHLFRWRS